MAKYQIETDNGVYEIETDDTEKASHISLAGSQLKKTFETTGNVMRGQPQAVSDVSETMNRPIEPLKALSDYMSSKGTVGKVAGAMVPKTGIEALAMGISPAAKAPKVISTMAKPIEKYVAKPTEKAISIAGKSVGKAMSATGDYLSNTGVANFLKAIPKTFSRTKQIELWNNAKRSMFQSRGKMIDEYGKALEEATIKNPNAKINMKPVIEDLKTEDMAGILDPKVKLALNSSPKLKKLWENYGNPEVSENINAKEAQDMLNEISSRFPESKLAGKSDYRSADMSLKNLKNEIRAAQIEAYPDMIPVRKEYGDFMQAYKGMKGEFLSKHFFDNIDKNFNNPIVRTYIDKVLPKEAINDLGGYRQAAKALRWTKRAAGVAALGAAGKLGYEAYK
jgi:hypothetical protein